jgi:DNA mismatch repair protein MutL
VRFENGRSLYELLSRELGAQLSRVLTIPARGFSPFHAQAPVPTTTQKSAAMTDARDAALRVAGGALFEQPADEHASIHGAHASAEPGLDAEPDFYGSLRFLGQAGGTYLVCEGHDGLYVLDQHAAAERVTFDRLRKAYAKKSVPMQRLLIPETIAVSPDEAELVEANEARMLELGVEMRRVGPQAVSVSGVPKLLRSDPEEIARDLLAELTHSSAYPFSGAIDLVLATMACHGSIRAGDALAYEEVQALLESLREIDFSGHCPHGRPIVFRMSFDELGRRVGR